MEKVAQIESVEIMEIVEPTLKIFQEILEQKKDTITDVTRKTFKYGSTDRHNLDIYYPPTPSSDKTPILFFIYGGGYVSGERVLPAPFDLMYPCVGAFFARQGFITIIPDYRLAPQVHYPQPAEDVRDSILWTIAHRNELVSLTTPNPDTNSIIIIGQSAGAGHATTLILDPNVLLPDSDLRSKIRGVVMISGLYHFDIPTGFEEPAKLYWGSMEKVKSHSPLALLKSGKSNGITTLPKILLVEGEREPQALFDTRADFQKVLESVQGSTIPCIVGKGHNHVSLTAALSTGEGEEWAFETLKWIRANL